MTPRRLCLAPLILLGLLGCGPSVVSLGYRPAQSLAPVGPATVGVYRLVDSRPGWPARSPARTVAIIAAELPITYNVHAEADREVGAFVAEAIRSELGASGLKVAGGAEYNRAVGPEGANAVRAARADRAVLGRINYFGWIQPGFAGLLFQSGMPTGKVFVDLDLWVVAPSTGEVLWAGSVREKKDSGDSWSKKSEELSPLLADTLRAGLTRLAKRKDFAWAVSGVAAAPVAVAP